jgi:hypothetical protein
MEDKGDLFAETIKNNMRRGLLKIATNSKLHDHSAVVATLVTTMDMPQQHPHLLSSPPPLEVNQL